MADKLIIEERLDYGYSLRWILDDGEGGAVGELRGRRVRADIATAKDPEYVIAEVVAAEEAKRLGLLADACGFRFKARADATRCLRLIRAEIKAHRDGKPLPEWARTAVAHGWRAPKGWRP